ncbi:MAG TPA: hypothetical protein VHQ90_15785 [Thermoanaerobaculia bacterium]|nr:hypothetical protein [Thermoanaerobaculia bacterium]
MLPLAAILCAAAAAAPSPAASGSGPAPVRALPPATPAAVSAAAPLSPAAFHRVRIPVPGGIFPYTVELPEGWAVHEMADQPVLWLGPADGNPPADPRLVYVRISTVSLLDADAVATSIRKSVPADRRWTAPRIEILEVGGVRGLLVRMDSNTGGQARSTLILKLPLPKTSVDFMSSAPRADFDKLLPSYERILLSVRPK